MQKNAPGIFVIHGARGFFAFSESRLRLSLVHEDEMQKQQSGIDDPQGIVTDRLLNELDGLYADRRRAEEVLDKIEADIAALRRGLRQMGIEDV